MMYCFFFSFIGGTVCCDAAQILRILPRTSRLFILLTQPDYIELKCCIFNSLMCSYSYDNFVKIKVVLDHDVGLIC